MSTISLNITSAHYIEEVSSPLFTSTYPQHDYEIDKLLSLKYLSHLFGDSFISESSLEGWVLEDALLHMLTLLRENQELLPVKDFIDKFEKCLQIRGEYTSLILNVEDENSKRVAIKELGLELIQNIKALPLGESLIFPGGYRTHVCLFEVTKTGEDTFQFSVYNTGEGAKRHWVYYNASRAKIQGCYRLSHIQGERLLNLRFFESLLRLLLKEECEFGVELYDEILPDLEGDREKIPSDPFHFMTPQRSGTCAWKPLCAYLRYNMPLEDYKRFMLIVKLQVFEKWRQLNHPFNCCELNRTLLDKYLLGKKDIGDLSREELLALSVIKVEKMLVKYRSLLKENEMKEASQLMAYFDPCFKV